MPEEFTSPLTADIQVEVDDTPAPEVVDTPSLDTTPFDFKKHIPEKYRKEKIWESVPDFDTLAKNYVERSNYAIGAVKMPKADAPKEEWDAFHTKMGRPTAPQEYTAESENADPKVVSMLRNAAFNAGLNPTQWNHLFNGYQGLQNDTLKEMRENAQLQSELTTDELKEEWGGAYSKNIGLAQRAVRALGDDSLLTDIAQSPLGNNKSFIMFLARAGKALSENNVIPEDVAGVSSSEEIDAQINTLTASKEYLDGNHPNHRAAVKKVTELFQLRHS